MSLLGFEKQPTTSARCCFTIRSTRVSKWQLVADPAIPRPREMIADECIREKGPKYITKDCSYRYPVCAFPYTHLGDREDGSQIFHTGRAHRG